MTIAHRLSISTVAFVVGLGTSPVLAQTVTDTFTANTNASQSDTLNATGIDRLVDRDLNQETRIDDGLKSGQLTAAEAARLERGESRIDTMESNALNSNSGQVSDQEVDAIRRAQARENASITRLSDNNVTATAGSNAAFANDVQRDTNQQQRIDNGLANGSITNSELASLESGQAANDQAQFQAGRNNSLSSSEQQQLRTDENSQSTAIRDDRTNDTVVSGTGAMNNGDHDRHDRFADSNGNDRDNMDRDDKDRDRFDSSQNQNGQFGMSSENSSMGQVASGGTIHSNANVTGQVPALSNTELTAATAASNGTVNLAATQTQTGGQSTTANPESPIVEAQSGMTSNTLTSAGTESSASASTGASGTTGVTTSTSAPVTSTPQVSAPISHVSHPAVAHHK